MTRTIVWLAPSTAIAIALGAAGVHATQAPSDALAFTVPPGYTQQKSDGVVLPLVPASPERTPCLYGFAGRHLSTGSLETDAEAALTKMVVPGWQRIGDNHYAQRGTSAAGWSYFWYRAAFSGSLNGQRANVNAMAMVLQVGPGQVHVVWGMGDISKCMLDDVPFEQLFNSLRPAGWTSDGGQALTRALQGTWRFTAGSAGMHQLTFGAGGRYERDLGSTAQVGVSERSSATVTGGGFTLRDGELTLTPEHRPQSPDRYYVRVYEEFSSIGWKHALVLFDSRAQPPNIVQYYRVQP